MSYHSKKSDRKKADEEEFFKNVVRTLSRKTLISLCIEKVKCFIQKISLGLYELIANPHFELTGYEKDEKELHRILNAYIKSAKLTQFMIGPAAKLS